jgi:hypothetical protein
MNKRIEELAIKSGLAQDMGRGYKFPDGYVEFAELIVKGCIGCCEQVISDPVPKLIDTWLNGGSQCIDEIKEHFGVE